MGRWHGASDLVRGKNPLQDWELLLWSLSMVAKGLDNGGEVFVPLG